MSFLHKLFGKKSDEKELAHQAKPLNVNLGDVQDFILEGIVEKGTPQAIFIQKNGAKDLTGIEDVVITPNLARQALKAKKHEHQAEHLVSSGKYGEAVKEYKLAIEIAPYKDELLYMSVGAILAELGKNREALRYLEIAHEINPLNERVAKNLATGRKTLV